MRRIFGGFMENTKCGVCRLAVGFGLVVLSTAAFAQTVPATGTASGQAGAVRGAVVEVPRAVVIAIEDIKVPAKQAGEIAKLEVDEGHVVENGAVLALIDDELARARRETADAELRIAEEQANSDAEVRAAEAKRRYFEAEYKVNQELFERRVVSSSELRKYKVQLESSDADVEVTVMKASVAKKTVAGKAALLNQAEIELKHHEVRARLQSGQARIVSVEKREGDWVQAGEAILRMVRMDKVRVEGYLNTKYFAPEEVDGQPVTIRSFETRGGKQVQRGRDVQGVIGFTNSVIDAGGDYRIWAEIDNPPLNGGGWVLRPGDSVQMTIKLKGQ